MSLRSAAFFIGVLIAAEAQAVAADCKVQSTRAPGQWHFIKAYDADTGEIVLQQVVSGGSSKDVSVSRGRVRVDWKLPGDAKYRTGAVSVCRKGNILKV